LLLLGLVSVVMMISLDYFNTVASGACSW